MMKSLDFGKRTYALPKRALCFGATGEINQETRVEYKGYIGQFTYDENIDLFEGSIANIKDLILFRGKSIESLRFAFQDAINEYLSWCKKRGKEPEKPSSLFSPLTSTPNIF